MAIAAHQSRLAVLLGGCEYAVVRLNGREEFNRPFQYQLWIVVHAHELLNQYLNSSAHISMTAPDGGQRHVHGIVSGVYHDQPLGEDSHLWRVDISSHLYRLSLRTDTRLLLNQDLPQIIADICSRHDLGANSPSCDWTSQYSNRPHTLQARESDFAFLARICSHNGLLFWSETQGEAEQLCFTDSSSRCLPLPREVMQFRPSGGLDKLVSANDILTLEQEASLVTDQYLVHDVSEHTDSALIASRNLPGSGKSAYSTTQDSFGEGLSASNEAGKRAQLIAQIGCATQFLVHISTHAADLTVGRILRIEAERADLAGDFLIIAIDHELRQYAGLGLGGSDDCPYTNRVTLVPRETAYRVKKTALPELPFTFQARIESRDDTATLDAGGRTRYRQHNDSEAKSFGENSINTRRMQPLGGPGNGHQPGWHMPLLDGAEVLVSCLNSDPDRPMIVGTLPNPENRSPVTSANPHQNIIRTAHGQELLFDDRQEGPVISLKTFAGHNILHLNAARAEHLIRLASDQGLAEIYVKQTIHTQCDDSLTETVGNNRTLVVEEKHETVTNQSEIHHQAATDALLRGANNIQLESGQNTEFETGQNMTLDISENTTITVGGSRAAINVDSGSLTMQASGAITIEGKGGGDIVIGQNGSGIKMDPTGIITLFGTNIDVQGAVSLNGKVNIDITSPPSVSLPAAIGAATVIGIGELIDQTVERESDEPFDLTINITDNYMNQLPGHFDELKGLRWAFTSDCGDERSGVIDSHTVVIKEVRIREYYEFGIENMPIHLD